MVENPASSEIISVVLIILRISARAYCVPHPKHTHNNPMSGVLLALSVDGDTSLREVK